MVFFLDLCPPSASGHNKSAVLNKTNGINGVIVKMGTVYVDPSAPGCISQNERLNLIFTIAVVFLCCVKFPVGIFLDAFGPRLTRSFGCVIYSIACVGLAFTEQEYANILFPVFILICGGGSLNVVSLYQVCNIVYKNTKSLVLCILHGAFDSSAVMLLLFKLAYDDGIRLRDISLFYGAVSAITVIISTVFLIPPRTMLLRWNKSPEEQKREAEEVLERRRQRFSSHSLQGETYVLSESTDVERRKSFIVYKPIAGEQASCRKAKFQKYGSAAPVSWQSKDEDKEQILVTDENEKGKSVENFRAPETIWQAVFSPLYLFELVYLSCVQLKLWFFVGSVNLYLEVLTDHNSEEVSRYVDIFGYIQLCGIVVTPFIGAVFDKSIFLGKSDMQEMDPDKERIHKMRGAVLPFVITSFLCLVLCAISLIKSLPVLITCFVFYTIVRGFMYSNHGAYIGIAFPAEFFGRLYGLGVFTAGIFGLLQYGLFVVTTTYLDGDPFWMNLLLLVLNLGTTALPVYIYLYCKRATENGIFETEKEEEVAV